MTIPTEVAEAKYRKKPVVIDALQYTGDNIDDVLQFMEWRSAAYDRRGGLEIHTLEGYHKANVGDWIIKGVAGEFYPCKPEIFAATYEPADRIESALTKAEAVAWRYKMADGRWVYSDGPRDPREVHDNGRVHERLYAHAPPAESDTETCESGLPDCGHVEHWDVEGVPLCRRCWSELEAESVGTYVPFRKLAAEEITAPAPPAVPVESLGRDAEPDEVAEYVDDYEYRGETEDGRDACYTPNERERLLIEDAIRGWEDRTTAAEPPATVPDGLHEGPTVKDALRQMVKAARYLQNHVIETRGAKCMDDMDIAINSAERALTTNQEGADP